MKSLHHSITQFPDPKWIASLDARREAAIAAVRAKHAAAMKEMEREQRLAELVRRIDRIAMWLTPWLLVGISAWLVWEIASAAARYPLWEGLLR